MFDPDFDFLMDYFGSGEEDLIYHNEDDFIKCSADGCSARFIKTKAIPYCYGHEKECPVNSCSQRVAQSQEYCQSHKQYQYYQEIASLLANLVKETDLSQVLGSFDNFSINEGKTCSEPNCNKEIGTCYQRCSEHKKPCQVRGCASDISYLGDYCYSHLNVSLKDCSLAGCNNQATNPEIYCQQHQWGCKYDYCSTRVPFGKYCCSQHANVVCGVSYCSQPKDSNGYCSSHRYVCQEFGCSKRDSGNYCFDHGGICQEENCSRRISFTEECCVVHQVRSCQKCSKRIGQPKERKWWEISEPEGKEFSQRMDSLCSNCAADFLLNTCEVLSCENRRVNRDQKHCAQHAYQCNYWSGDWHCYHRTSSSYGYCSSHSKTCLSCSAHIDKDSGYNYCSQHQNSCANCSARISSREKYCTNCQSAKRAQATEQNQLKSLVRQKTSLANPQEVTRFSTNWNQNLATVINNYYWVFLLVLEENNSVKVFPVSASETKWGIGNSRIAHSSLMGAQSEASWLRGKLNGNNPILYVHPSANSIDILESSFSNIVGEPYVTKKNIPLEGGTYTYWYPGGMGSGGIGQMTKNNYPTNPSQYVKPLDIVWVKRSQGPGTDFYHVGVYLGFWNSNYWMCHLDGDNRGVEIITWQNFVKEDHDRELIRELISFHPTIPFKHRQDIIRQALWAKNNNFRRGSYNLANANCEHLANLLVYGLDYSQQAERLTRMGGLGLLIGRGIPNMNSILSFAQPTSLTQRISNSDNKLGKSYSSEANDLIAQVEIPAHMPTDRCSIM